MDHFRTITDRITRHLGAGFQRHSVGKYQAVWNFGYPSPSLIA